MNATQLELDILHLLRIHRQGLACYDIARKMNKYPSQIHRKLKKMEKHNIISSSGHSKPRFWRITMEQNKIEYYEVECPKCSTRVRVETIQQTALCPNLDCLTKSGNRTRFHINKRRIIKNVNI